MGLALATQGGLNRPECSGLETVPGGVQPRAGMLPARGLEGSPSTGIRVPRLRSSGRPWPGPSDAHAGQVPPPCLLLPCCRLTSHRSALADGPGQGDGGAHTGLPRAAGLLLAPGSASRSPDGEQLSVAGGRPAETTLPRHELMGTRSWQTEQSRGLGTSRSSPSALPLPRPPASQKDRLATIFPSFSFRALACAGLHAGALDEPPSMSAGHKLDLQMVLTWAEPDPARRTPAVGQAPLTRPLTHPHSRPFDKCGNRGTGRQAALTSHSWPRAGAGFGHAWPSSF